MEYVLGGLLLVVVAWFVYRKLKRSNLPAKVLDKAEKVVDEVKEEVADVVSKPKKNKKNVKNVDTDPSV